MRDLTSRLRDIVRQEKKTSGVFSQNRDTRELTYVPDAPAVPENIADHLGGEALDPEGACVVIDRRYALDRSHGRRRIETCVPAAGAPLHLFDPRLAGRDDWSRRVVFFDIETTGLSGGAGTLAFLVGCGWFDADGLVVRQFLLTAPGGERPMLDALARVFGDTSLLVTYNGRSFDVPLMETRWAFHRSAPPTDDLPHFDMLPAARRLWSGRDEGCSLSTIERSVLGFHRLDDVPGFEIPARYFHFLRTGDARAIDGVLEHNRHDLVSLAVVMAHALWLAHEGPDACREPDEQLALGRVYERAGDTTRARRAFEMAAEAGDADVRQQALARLALMLRRDRRYAEAADAWEQVLGVPRSRRSPLSPIERQAAEALAIHHEHRQRDLAAAKRYAQALDGHASERRRLDVDRRLQRLDRKMRRTLETGRPELDLG